MPGTSAYLTNYRTTFYDVAGVLVTVDIEDRASGAAVGSPVYTPLSVGTGSPLTIETVNNSQDPFNPILAKSAKFRFLSTSTFTAGLFSSGTDNRYYLEAYTSAVIIFRGFVLMDDNEEPFLNPAFSHEVTLTATDNIGTLKDLEYINNATGLPVTDGHFSILFYVQSCLERTGLSLSMNIVWNLFEEDMITTDSPLWQLYVWTLSFEKELTTKENCYTILTKILSSLKARLFQYNGEWWIVRLHEYRRITDTLQFIKYDAAGTKIAAFSGQSCAAAIAGNQSLYLINADARKTAQRPHKFDKDSYRYEFPREIVRNIDFTRGAFIIGVNPKHFILDNWTLMHSDFNSYVTNNTSAYIKRTYDANEVEEERYVVMTAGTVSGSHQYYLLSENIPIHKNDKFNISIDFRYDTDFSGPSGTNYVPVLQIRLIGDDGSKWLWNDGNPAGNAFSTRAPRWVNLPTSDVFTGILHFVWHTWDVTTQDDKEWMNVSSEVAPLPVDGSIQVVMMHSRTLAGWNILAYNKHFANLRFDYLPYMVGTYAKYKSQYNSVTQLEKYKANSENELDISESPKKLFKGALFKVNYLTGKYVLTENWTDGFDAGASGTGRIGKILVYDVWNQYRTQRFIINGTARGVGQGIVYCPLYSRFTFSDFSATKKFICLHYDLDVKRGEATGEFIEVFDTDETNDYTTTHEFQYEQ